MIGRTRPSPLEVRPNTREFAEERADSLRRGGRPNGKPRRTLTAVALAGGIALAVLAGIRALAAAPRVERYGMVIGVKPEKIAEYKRLHAAAWPGVLRMIRECNIRNYSIYLRELEPGKFYLFSYFEYTGDDFAADMKKMAADPTTRAWWKETDPCQLAIPLKREGEFWSRMDEVFHTD